MASHDQQLAPSGEQNQQTDAVLGQPTMANGDDQQGTSVEPIQQPIRSQDRHGRRKSKRKQEEDESKRKQEEDECFDKLYEVLDVTQAADVKAIRNDMPQFEIYMKALINSMVQSNDPDQVTRAPKVQDLVLEILANDRAEKKRKAIENTVKCEYRRKAKRLIKAEQKECNANAKARSALVYAGRMLKEAQLANIQGKHAAISLLEMELGKDDATNAEMGELARHSRSDIVKMIKTEFPTMATNIGSKVDLIDLLISLRRSNNAGPPVDVKRFPNFEALQGDRILLNGEFYEKCKEPPMAAASSGLDEPTDKMGRRQGGEEESP